MKSFSVIPRNAAIRAASASDTRTIPSLIRQHAPQRRQVNLIVSLSIPAFIVGLMAWVVINGILKRRPQGSAVPHASGWNASNFSRVVAGSTQ